MSKSPPCHSKWSDSVWYALTILLFIFFTSLAGYAVIQQQKEFLLQDKQNEIETIADLKSTQLVQWRKERFAEGASIRANAMIAQRINDYIRGNDKAGVRHEFKLWLANMIDLGEYSEGILFTTNAEIITSTSEQKLSPSKHDFYLVKEATTEQELILSDFHSDDIGKPFDINLAVPIIHFDGNKSKCVAVLVLYIDPAKQLFPLIRSWPTTSESAETLLVKREGNSVLFLNELRHRKKTEIPFLHPMSDLNMPAVKAALGKEGNFTGIDYRNKSVLCTIRVIPGTKWGMVSKVDTDEVLAPLANSIWMIISVGTILVITMTLGIFLWGIRRKSEILSKLVDTEKRHNTDLKKSEEKLELQVLDRTRDLFEINALLRLEMDERNQLEQKLLTAKRLEAIGQIASGVAHEVRNPLNAILTITEALFKEKEIENNPEYEPFIHHIRTQVNRLAQLMNDLLDLGRTIPEANLQPVALYYHCVETLDLWQATGMAKSRRALLESDKNDVSIIVSADPHKLQQIFYNLLENAANHTPADGNITLRLTSPDSGEATGIAVVQVIDQGSGIPKEKLCHVFEPFYTDRKGGTGLGLALVKHFIENMGGTVQIWNNQPPPGCTVEVRIPLHCKELK